MERVKRLAGNEIELGMKIPTIESWASNIPMTKGITYVDIAVRPIKIFVEYVGTNMSIQVSLLVAIAFFMTYTCSYDYEIMQLPFTGGTLCVLPNVTM